MIKLQKTYTIDVTEQQLKELYELLKKEKQDCSVSMSFEKDLVSLYNELYDYMERQ